jgi:transposase
MLDRTVTVTTRVRNVRPSPDEVRRPVPPGAVSSADLHTRALSPEGKLAVNKSIRGTDGITIGIDVGDKRSEAVVLDRDGNWCGGQTIPTNRDAMSRAFGGLEGARVVIEVGTHSPWMSRVFADRGFEVIAANARRVRLIAAAHRKNDKVDAETLARLGRLDPELLAPVIHRSQQAQRDMCLLRARDGLVRSRTSTITQVRAMAKSLGFRIPSCSSPSFPERVRATLGERELPGVTELLQVIELLTHKIRELDARIEEVALSRYPEHKILTQIRGVGTLTALSFLLVIHDPHRFAKSRDVAAYLGLVPKQRDSGDRHTQLGISKRGDPYTRRLLVSCARHIMGPFGAESDLRSFGMRIAASGSIAARNRAAIAVARKLAVLLHRLWLTGEVYEPVGYTPRGAHLCLPASDAA